MRPASPSWKTLDMRSSSLPHSQNSTKVKALNRQGQNPRKESSKEQVESNEGRSWATTQIMHGTNPKPKGRGPSQGVSVSPVENVMDALKESPPRRRQTSMRRTPILTMALLKLNECMSEFCQYLSDPTFENARKAMQLLDTMTAKSSSSNSPELNSPAPTNGSPGPYTASPPLSPIASWFIGSYHTEPSSDQSLSGSPSALALEGECDKFVNPLNLFAGLEAVYASVAHASQDRIVAHNLFLLYQRVKEDLCRVRETLCDPFPPSATNSAVVPAANLETPLAPITTYGEKAYAVGMSLNAIMSACHCRCQLIRLQLTLWNTDFLDFDDASSLFQTIQPPTPIDNSSYASPLVKRISSELEMWFHLMEMASSICKFRFADSIINAQRVKLCLNQSSTTCMDLWLLKLLQQMISVLPIFYDRVDASARSLYGFQKGSFDVQGKGLLGSSQHVVEAKISDFLKVEERSGPAMAIAVIFDASANGSKILNLDVGFALAQVEENKKMMPSTENQRALLRYPAIYLRSTVQPSASTRLLGMGRTNGRKERDGSNTFDDVGTHNSNRFEDLASWPYTAWAGLTAMLSEVTLDPELPSDQLQWAQADSDTSFRATAINDSMWLVVMTKTADDNRWHRRKTSKLVDNDLHEFFDEILGLLRMSEWFKSSHALEIRRLLTESSARLDLAIHLKSERKWDDKNTQGLLQSFKESFGLRTPRTKESFKASYGIRFGKERGRTPRTKESFKASYGIRFGKERGRKSPKHFSSRKSVTNAISSHALSANAFFLGSQLMNAIGAD